jgi:hypothetical protein
MKAPTRSHVPARVDEEARSRSNPTTIRHRLAGRAPPAGRGEVAERQEERDGRDDQRRDARVDPSCCATATRRTRHDQERAHDRRRQPPVPGRPLPDGSRETRIAPARRNRARPHQKRRKRLRSRDLPSLVRRTPYTYIAQQLRPDRCGWPADNRHDRAPASVRSHASPAPYETARGPISMMNARITSTMSLHFGPIDSISTNRVLVQFDHGS